MGIQVKIRYLIPIMLILILILGMGCVGTPNFCFSAASLPIADQASNNILSSVNPSNSPAIANIINKVRPAVVAIDVELAASNISGHPITEQIAGSGWVLNQDGLIVTNSHVVEGARNVTVTLESGQTYTAKTIRTDPVNDLALIDIGVGNLMSVTMGDSSKIRVGDQVIAIGNALGEEIKATQGIISSTNATFTVDNQETLNNVLETTAPIVHGFSGGPLINMDGEVIGITTGACLNASWYRSYRLRYKQHSSWTGYPTVNSEQQHGS